MAEAPTEAPKQAEPGSVEGTQNKNETKEKIVTDDGETKSGDVITSGGDTNDGNTKGKEVKLTVIPTSEFDRLYYQEQYKQFLFMTTIKAPYFRPENRAPIDLICVIDESGSMSGQRIALVKETLQFIVKNLEGHDRFGCVGYSNSARCILDLTTMDEDGKKKAAKAVEGARASGSTALCDGLLLGLSMMRQRESKTGSVASLMLFTDGRANVGYTSAPDIIRAISDPEGPTVASEPRTKMNYQVKKRIKQSIKQTEGEERKESVTKKGNEGEGEQDSLSCSINTFGFGEGHNEDLLQAIAEHGRGMYAYIKDASMISNTFAECLGGLVSVVAQNITLRVDTLNEVKINKCLSLGLALKVIRPNQCYEVTFSDIQSEETRNVIFELGVPNVNEPKADWSLAQVVCSYENSILKGTKEQVSVIASIQRSDSKETGERNYELDLQNNRIVAAEAMTEADELANSGKLKEARARLNKAQDLIKTSKSNQDKYSAGLIGDIQRCVEGLQDEISYSRSGGKQLKMNSKAHHMERAVQSSAWASQEKYTNSSKKKMMSKFKG